MLNSLEIQLFTLMSASIMAHHSPPHGTSPGIKNWLDPAKIMAQFSTKNCQFLVCLIPEGCGDGKQKVSHNIIRY